MIHDFKCADPFCRHLSSDHDPATGKCLKKPSGVSLCSCDGLVSALESAFEKFFNDFSPQIDSIQISLGEFRESPLSSSPAAKEFIAAMGWITDPDTVVVVSAKGFSLLVDENREILAFA